MFKNVRNSLNSFISIQFTTASYTCFLTFKTRLVYTTEHSLQEAQLPQRNSTSAAHMEGARPSSPLSLRPLWLYTYAHGHRNRNKLTKRTLRWIGHSRSSLLVPAGIPNGVLS